MEYLSFLFNKYDILITGEQFVNSWTLNILPFVILFLFIIKLPFNCKIKERALKICADKLKDEEIISVCSRSKNLIFQHSVAVGAAGAAIIFMPIDLLHVEYKWRISLIVFIVFALFGAYTIGNTSTIYTKRKIIFISSFFKKNRIRELKYKDIKSYAFRYFGIYITSKENKIACAALPTKKEEKILIEELIRNGGENLCQKEKNTA